MMGLLFCLLLSAILPHITTAQDPAGNFINIDCGLPAGTSYNDEVTGLTYISDAAFTDAGISKNISADIKPSSIAQQLQFVRSFPDGNRNCYKVGVVNDNKYLIRATFMYADYDGLYKAPQFDLHVGPNRWVTVVLNDATSVVYKEIVYHMTTNYIYICLVNTRSGTPFISALELRPLKDGPYSTQKGSIALACFLRFDFGLMFNETIRYPNDILDRMWLPYSSNEVVTINTTKVIDYQSPYFVLAPPLAVMRTATTPANTDEPLEFLLDSEDTRVQFDLYLYFAEVQKLLDNQSRQFDVYLNGNVWIKSFSPQYLHSIVFYSTAMLNGGGPHHFVFTKTANSTHPPSINAIEIYSIVQLTQNQTDQLEVDAIMNVKLIYQIKRNWQGDPCAPQAYLWDGLNCDNSKYDVPRIISLNLSSSGLVGEITPFISNITLLQYLDLSYNNLTGPVPDFLTQLPFLKVLNLTHNQLTGTVPSPLIEMSKQNLLVLRSEASGQYNPSTTDITSMPSRLEENPNLCLSLTCKKKKKKMSTYVIVVLASVAVLLTAFMIFILGYGLTILLPRLLRHKQEQAKTNKLYELLKSKTGCFTYPQLISITNNFERVIGKGGFGTVYHGYLHGDQVAVKILSSSSAHGYKQFQAEVNALLRVHHGNLLSLIGYCEESNQMGLIYEYMANGNLEEYMSDNSRHPLNWEERLRISLGVAQGLEYLHKGCEPHIVHRDVKPSNILLDEKLQAKLADFGLSRSFPINGGSHFYTDVVGTFGYFDPEYFRSRRFTTRSDVYSFGVVLLEIITSKPAIIEIEEMTHISQWVSSMLTNGEAASIVDPKLGGEFDNNSVKKVVELAMACVSLTSLERPTMNQVVNELTDCLAMELARNKEHEVESKNASTSVNSSDSSL